ncbi:bifunctional 4-hydroxy-2-oxoglutarate aldolase/2-dehydro-3-deoxy-phosphogluconate aldolase [Agromyces aerolatus]|uniref:bifunctional 4-hydroxy-2-oxoglutarate aldolase/2-dehydro-3-deoxy-phosphogluconate aldolase n=1 Tax=Agromyces sp. LY-1074 TaxID=3074080 RepID=UPI00285DB7DC|nr:MULTISPECIES: bifunctional 4-hydroxy-2-oxoglutarate aldolase/2-dehydro-3-deoxy-phosphogluconate aldolase [unclassified Agromyces]MDR5701208.1 bifunctional 4-hydroxy-2-oxoglutarate aldolase/2-dehydro-3-deoxy-phosphogluconate aldolase [Agromyces sp. LY-1074]MDR5706916.1 bifunctional 4-hydroxy-2-oxoglutarate aldolase/2-dehydro-3-deoxy-phosphogluconate aldolase [Agromyces sp. LY-1358]
MTHTLPGTVTSGRVVPVLTAADPASAVSAARGLLAGGIRCVEVTLRTARAWDAVAAIRDEVPEIVLGVGTALTADDVVTAHRLGAAFAVAPGFDREAVSTAHRLDLPMLPGIATPSELMSALAVGVRCVKVFPAGALGGPGFLRSLSAVFPAVGLIPSGGISTANAAAYLEIESVTAVSGSWMLPADAVERCDSERIAELSRDAARLAPARA